MILERKICGICGVDKDKSEYAIRTKPNGYSWLRRECKDCNSEMRRRRYDNIPEVRSAVLLKNKNYAEKNKGYINLHNKEYRKINSNEIKRKSKNRYEKNKEIVKQRRREYYRKNAARHIAVVAEYNKNNKPQLLAKKRENHKRKRETDLHYKIMKVLRSRLANAIKLSGNGKHHKTIDLVGCNIPFLIKYLESKFVNGMSWDNYGLRGWHVDHILPCASFDFSDVNQQRECFHYTNLQPLWARDNIAKSDKLNYETGLRQAC